MGWRESVTAPLLGAVALVPLFAGTARALDHPGGASRASSGTLLSTEEPPLDARQTRQVLAKREAIERGLRFLSEQQAKEGDGSIPSIGTKPARLAVTALGVLAYLSAGNTPGRGPHGAQVNRAVDFLLSHVDRDSTSRTRGYISDSGDKNSKLHAHGFAALALAEAYTLSPRTDRGVRIGDALELSLRLMESSQGLEGGWFYDPIRGIEHEGSVTIALVQAMRAAKNAGLRVDPKVIAKAVEYVRRSQRADGAFRYAIGNDQVSLALTAAAISTLNATGKYHGAEIQQGFDSIQRSLALREHAPVQSEFGQAPASVRFPYYERLYLAQAFWQNPDRRLFDDWFATERENLLRSQNEDGSWNDPRFGPAYATAINVLVLAIPDQLLPIFQR